MALAHVIAHKIYHRKTTSLIKSISKHEEDEDKFDYEQYKQYKPKKTIEPDKESLLNEFNNNL